MEQAIEAGKPGNPKHQRKLRNFLLDARFQLKYAGYAVAIAIFLSAALGALLWRTSARMVEESDKVTKVVEMTIADDPVYSELLGGTDLGQNAELKAYHERIHGQQRDYAIILIGGLALFVLGIGLGGIVLTHKVAGPVYKLKRELVALGDGNFKFPVPIRRGDELQDVFLTFNDAVGRLRREQEDRLKRLNEVLSRVEGALGSDDAQELKAIQEEMARSLGH